MANSGKDLSRENAPRRRGSGGDAEEAALEAGGQERELLRMVG
ncbi:MAG: hypothetical protein OXN89_24885 [Bryobacterales bacterium]|nr:hypothetical protein [Bryobacterales bacterium]